MTETNYWIERRRAISRRRFLAGAAKAGAGLAALGLIGCGGGNESSSPARPDAVATPSGQPKQGGRLIVVQSGGPGFLDAHASTGGQDVTFLRALYDNLVKRADDFVPKEDWSIAESWEIKQDGKEIVFHIRSGVKFQDGTPLDAEAVKFNFDRFMDPSLNSPERANMTAVDKVEVINTTTARFLLSRPSASVLPMLGDRAGMLLSPTALQAKGKDAFRRDPVTSGPFKFKEWVQDDHITMVRNENYWRKGLPYLDEIRWNFIKEPAVHLANLEAGTADSAAVSEIDLERVRPDPNLKVMQFAGGYTVNFYINNSFPPFDNKYNRLAFAWAIDREAIIKGLMRGSGVAANGAVSIAHKWAYTPDVPNAPKKDNAKAKEFLSKAGNPKGYEVKIVGGNSSTNIQQAEAIKAQLAEVGINMIYEPLDVTTYVNKVMVEKSVASQFSSIVLRGDPNQLSQVFHSDGFYNPAHLKDEVGLKIDDLLLKADSTFDLSKRKALYLELSKVLNEEARGIFLWYSVTNRVMNKKVEGWSFGSEGNARWEETWINA